MNTSTFQSISDFMSTWPNSAIFLQSKAILNKKRKSEVGQQSVIQACTNFKIE